MPAPRPVESRSTSSLDKTLLVTEDGFVTGAVRRLPHAAHMANNGPNHRMNAAIVDTEQPRLPKRFWWGCALWVAFSVVAMLLRGVRWDENFEFAQAMTGQVPYPDGHPMVQ